MKRLLDVLVSILVVIALFMSQSWAVTAAYADYSIDGSDDSNSFILKALLPIKLSLSLRGKNRMLAP